MSRTLHGDKYIYLDSDSPILEEFGDALTKADMENSDQTKVTITSAKRVVVKVLAGSLRDLSIITGGVSTLECASPAQYDEEVKRERRLASIRK